MTFKALMLGFLLTISGMSAAQAQGSAQQDVNRPMTGIGSKTMDFCAADIKKHCSAIHEPLQKECLVKNWTRISGDCQDAVGVRHRR